MSLTRTLLLCRRIYQSHGISGFRHFMVKPCGGQVVIQNKFSSCRNSGFVIGKGNNGPVLRFNSTLAERNNGSKPVPTGKKRPCIGRWILLPLPIGFIFFGYWTFGGPEPEEAKPVKDFQVKWYRFLPLKTLSRLWGWMHSVDLPEWLREPVLSLYVKAFGCDLSEAQVEDLKSYRNLGEFFRRPLKENARPIAPAPIVSPSDGKVLHFGKIDCGEIEQVKGLVYSLSEFLGPPTWQPNCDNPHDPNLLCSCDKYSSLITRKPSNSLYHIVIYLAPGDYHRFHVPTDWKVNFRRHVAGDLLSVSPRVANLVKGLFNFNERAVYVGEWKHGFFSFVAVGATNVGTIRIYSDQALETNKWNNRKGSQNDVLFNEPLSFRKGEPFGEFNLGSTVVLVFEAPSDSEFLVQPGQKIRVGQPFIALKGDNNYSENSSSSNSRRWWWFW